MAGKKKKSKKKDWRQKIKPWLNPFARFETGKKVRAKKKKPAGEKKGSLPKTRLGRFAYWSGVALVWGLIAFGFLLFFLVQNLPDPDNLPPPGEASRIEILDRNGELLTAYGAIYGDRLTYDEIPPVMVDAITAIEDQRFFDHGGVDIPAIFRAFWVNLTSLEIRQGASTITQQLAKNLFLTRERTFQRKAKEFLLALELERQLTKQEILALYLNRVYFGSGAYGLDAAAKKYFDHSARRLNLQEAALLAGLVKAPSVYSPLRNKGEAIERTHVVLGAMVDAGHIDAETAERAKAAPAKIPKTAFGTNIRYFTDWVLDRVPDLVGQDHTGPYFIYTTLEENQQEAAGRALRNGLNITGKARNAGNGAFVVMTPDGAVKAMVGGKSYAESQFNRAVQAKRQPGSAFKVAVYLAAFKQGLEPEDEVRDAPITVDGWSPNNFDKEFRGDVSLREAFAFSLNTVAVRVSEQVGRENVVKMAKELGLKGDIPAHPSLALGTHEVTPLELTSMYAGIANGGRRVEPYAILEIRTGEGNLIYRRAALQNPPVLEKDLVNEITALLAYTVERGTGRRAQINRPIAGKSGTSQDYRDAWFVGFSSDFVGGVWIGNDDDTPMEGVTGGTLPAEIWGRAMRDIHQGHPMRPLPYLEEDSFLDRLFSRRD